VHGAERLTYKELSRRTAGLATGLRQHGLKRGDRMGIYLDASVQQVVSIFGASQAEGVYVPVNILLHPEQVMHIARDCGMKGLITTPAKLEALAEVLPQIPSLEFLVVTGSGDIPGVKLPVYATTNCVISLLQRLGRDQHRKRSAAILTPPAQQENPRCNAQPCKCGRCSRIVSTYLGITESERILAVLPSVLTLA